jgi:hypothetical protein
MTRDERSPIRLLRRVITVVLGIVTTCIVAIPSIQAAPLRPVACNYDTATARNEQGLSVLNEILDSPGGSTEVLDRVTNIWDSTGRGVRFGNGSRLAEMRANPERGSIGRGPLTPNKAIQRGQAPRGITRIDTPKVPNEQLHATFDDGSALNIDGTRKHGGGDLTRAQTTWLEQNGWTLP